MGLLLLIVALPVKQEEEKKTRRKWSGFGRGENKRRGGIMAE